LLEGGVVVRLDRDLGLLVVDVVLLGLRGPGDEPLRGPHSELETHSAAAPLAEAPFAGVLSSGTSRKRFVRPGPWMRSRMKRFSTEGRLTMNASAVVC